MTYLEKRFRRASLLGLALLAASGFAQTADLQHLRDQYLNKPLILRGFYSGDSLRYDSAGSPVGDTTAGDWTTDGIVQLSNISVTERHLSVTGVRLIVISYDNVFQFFARNKLGRGHKPPALSIEEELKTDGTLAENVEAALSKLFLTAQDSFRDLVPDYWKYCVQDALSDSDENCHFAKEFMAIPGFALGKRLALKDEILKYIPDPVGPPITPPNILAHEEARLSEEARKARYKGVVVFSLVLDSTGQARGIRILSPIGFGLDQRAFHALEGWRFKPAEKNGKPVAIPMQVQVDCIQ
jgi:TonB family protein